MSLLLDHGHKYAQFYPLGWVVVESDLVTERKNGEEATRAILLQLAVSSGMGGKGAAKQFNKVVKLLQE